MHSLSNPCYQNVHGGSKQEPSGDVFDELLQIAKNQIIGAASRVVHYWEPQELCIPNDELGFNKQ